MKLPALIAKHFRVLFLGPNWAAVSMIDQLRDITWEEATCKVGPHNSIATLVFHIQYYIQIQIKVLQGGPLEGKDSLSFIHPPIRSQEDWEDLRSGLWILVNQWADLVEDFPQHKLDDIFVEEKYGTFYRNFQGLIEHSYYHLGQIGLLKKLIKTK